MVTGNNYTRAYAEALIVGTPADQLSEREGKRNVKGYPRRKLRGWKRRWRSLERDYRLHQDQFGNSLHLNAVQRYVKRLLENTKIKRFLKQRYSELLEEFQELAALESLSRIIFARADQIIQSNGLAPKSRNVQSRQRRIRARGREAW